VAKYIIRRILWTIPVLLTVILFSFLLMKAIPGGPFTREVSLPQQIVDNLNEKYGLDDPWYIQYARYIYHAVQGDLGVSMTQRGRTVTSIVGNAFPVSMQLGLGSFTLALIIGVPLGVIAALRHNSWADYLAIFVASIGWAIPVIIIAPLLIYFFSVRWRWFPAFGWGDTERMVLPIIALGTGFTAYFARLTRSAMLETLQQDYVRTAKAKGLPWGKVVWRHVLRNSLIPVVTQAGPLLGFLVTGSFLTEYIFSIPGMGRYFVDSVTNRDYSIVLGLAVILSAVIVFANLVVDILYGFLDPRIRYD